MILHVFLSMRSKAGRPAHNPTDYREVFKQARLSWRESSQTEGNRQALMKRGFKPQRYFFINMISATDFEDFSKCLIQNEKAV